MEEDVNILLGMDDKDLERSDTDYYDDFTDEKRRENLI